MPRSLSYVHDGVTENVAGKRKAASLSFGVEVRLLAGEFIEPWNGAGDWNVVLCALTPASRPDRNIADILDIGFGDVVAPRA